MGSRGNYDAVVVGAGPNGLTAAILLAKSGLGTLLIEAHPKLGGGCRTEELTLPGFQHDVCAAIHPMGSLSPAFKKLALEQHGLEWVQTPAPLAHVLEDRPVLLNYSADETSANLGQDGVSWKKLVDPYLRAGSEFFHEILKPVRFPRSPILMARFGLKGLRSCEALISSLFRGPSARALFTGCAAHSILDLNRAGTASFGLILALAAHATGWPCARGGSDRIIEALRQIFVAAGGETRQGTVQSLEDLPNSRVVLFDLTPRQIVAIASAALPPAYCAALKRFRYGGGVFKIDWALSGPIPWKYPECFQAATVHLGGTAEEVMRSEHQVASGRAPETPFVLLAQQSLFDSTRAPAGKQTGWAYCHVPNGCNVNMTERIEAQVERFAPGFKDVILARNTRSPAQYQLYNQNMIGGDIGGGSNHLSQFLFRPVPRWDPYSTPNPRLFICSSSTPPGGGVHGMCGYWAARSALRLSFGIRLKD